MVQRQLRQRMRQHEGKPCWQRPRRATKPYVGSGDPTRQSDQTDALLPGPQSATRGTKTGGGGGKLTQQLERQAKDGGRAEEARREAERKGNEPLVVRAL